MPNSPRRSRLLLAAVALATITSPAFGCSPGLWPFARSVHEFQFLGRATADTVFTGPGSMRLSKDGGHMGQGKPRLVHGQRVMLDRVGAPWVGQLPAGTKSVILVPWDYDAGCAPTFYSPTYRWVKDTAQSLFNGVLRDKGEWINGEPTFDVEMPSYYAPGRGHSPGTPDSLARLLPAEYLSLVEAMPREDSLELDRIRALSPLHAWAAAHRDLVKVFPAMETLDRARWHLEDGRRSRFSTAIAGTYRVSVHLPWRETITFFATTEAASSTNRSWRDRGDSLKQPYDEDGDPIAYVLYSQHAWVEDSLVKQPANWGRKERVPLPAFAGYDAVIRTRDSVVYRGMFDGLRVAVGMERDSTRKARLTELLSRSESEREGAFYYLPGKWVIPRGAPVRFEWTARNDKEVFYTVTAVQVSEWVLR